MRGKWVLRTNNHDSRLEDLEAGCLPILTTFVHVSVFLITDFQSEKQTGGMNNYDITGGAKCVVRGAWCVVLLYV